MECATYQAPAYHSSHPFSELCVEGQRRLIIERWARMLDPTCFDTPVHHPLIEGAQAGADGEVSCRWDNQWTTTYRPTSTPRDDEKMLERGLAFGRLLRSRFTPHALKRTVRRLQARVAELEQRVRELGGEVT